MNIVEFNQMVSDSLRRGNTLDAQIPRQTSLAVQWMERNYTFKYMEGFRLITIQQGQRVILMPSGVLVKAWNFFRIINSDGSYTYINKVEGKDFTNVASTANTLISGTVPSTSTSTIKPANFFQVGLTTVVLDAVPSQNFNCEALFFNYSSWPVDSSTIPGGTSSFTHPLLQMMSDVLLAQVQMNIAANIMKDLRMVPVYKEMRDEALNTMTRDEDERRYGGEDMKMLYRPAYDESQLNNVIR
jgi:hypothetical protein